MGSHPINLIIRFLLEFIALIIMGFWGWNQSEGWLQFVLVLGLPIVAASIWGIFTVPNDPSRSGNAPIPVNGLFRLIIELVFFAFATWALYNLGYVKLSWVIGGTVIIHYIISYDRIKWLLKH
jgi:hypothetical protein